MTLFLSSNLFADTKKSEHFWLQEPSEECPRGRQLIVVDKNDDGELDWMIEIDCNGELTESPMKVVGSGRPFPEEGASARLISGELFGDSYIIEIYVEGEGNDDDSTLAYLVKENGQEVATFYYDGFFKP